MGSINDRSVIYNSVKIFITDKCKIRVSETNVSEGGKEVRDRKTNKLEKATY